MYVCMYVWPLRRHDIGEYDPDVCICMYVCSYGHCADTVPDSMIIFIMYTCMYVCMYIHVCMYVWPLRGHSAR